MAKFNIKQALIRASMDYIGPNFPEWWGKNKSRYKLPDLLGINVEQLKGAKYFMTLKVAHKGVEYLFPNEPIVSIGMSKTIVKTATVGRDRKRSVKEFITINDETITIKGVCIDQFDPEVYPADQVKMINDLFEINAAVDVVDNAFFELFGIRSIVIEDLQWDEMIGESGMQTYSIRALGDDDFFADLNYLDKQKFNNL